VRSYRCSACRGWHITSQQARTPAVKGRPTGDAARLSSSAWSPDFSKGLYVPSEDLTVVTELLAGVLDNPAVSRYLAQIYVTLA
jgi:hypothetical protein